MTTVKELLDLLTSQEGDKYVFGVEVSPSESNPKAFDCSELVEWGCDRLGITPTMPDGAIYQVRHCRKNGLLIPVKQAIQTAGALLFCFSDDPFTGDRPSQAHVAVSLGNGKSFEARGKAYGVGTFSALGRGWTHAGLIPGLDYGAAKPSPPPEPSAPEPAGSAPPETAAGEEINSTNYQVTAQTRLNIRSGPGTDYEVYGTIAHGEVVISPDTSDWLPILLEDDSIGWVSRKYVVAVPEAPESPQPAAPEPGPTTPPETAVQPAAGAYDFTSKAGTIAAIKAECQKQGLGLATQIAYVLATTEWETGGTFKPVREAFYISNDFDQAEAWRKAHLRYYPYYGRGYVQLTWKDNYQKYADLLGIDLVAAPDKALEPATALFILVHGFKTGTFTGKKISDYLSTAATDFINARRCINALDQAEEIARLAEKYQKEMGA